MRELRFEGLSEDGTRLVLVGKDGQRWSVVIDERVEAAVRRDRARLGQVEIEQSGELRPREIQARIRAGATAEDVAAASGLPLERIRRFEGPVLTERAWIAQQAGQVPMRRASGDVTLAELVCERLASQGVSGEDITWDAWRPEDGAWIVIATFPLGPNTHFATWQYDTATRTITPVDDNAEDLSALPGPAKLRLVTLRPQLAAVTSSPSDESLEAPEQGGSDDIIDAPAARPRPTSLEENRPEPAPIESVQPIEVKNDQAETADRDFESQSTGSELPHIVLPKAQISHVEAVSDQPEESVSAATESDSGPRPTPRSLRRNGKRVSRHPSGSQLPTPPAPHPSSAPLPASRPESQASPVQTSDEASVEPPADANVKAKQGRTAVPSFDDILFGPAPKH